MVTSFLQSIIRNWILILGPEKKWTLILKCIEYKECNSKNQCYRLIWKMINQHNFQYFPIKKNSLKSYIIRSPTTICKQTQSMDICVCLITQRLVCFRRPNTLDNLVRLVVIYFFRRAKVHNCPCNLSQSPNQSQNFFFFKSTPDIIKISLIMPLSLTIVPTRQMELTPGQILMTRHEES